MWRKWKQNVKKIGNLMRAIARQDWGADKQ